MTSVIILSITTLLILYLFVYISKNRHEDQIRTAFFYTLGCLLIWCVGLIAQLLFSERFNINPLYFDYIVYIGTCFLPVTYFFIGLIFAKTKITFKKRYVLLGAIPLLTLILIWTNDFHHLFYVHYSTDLAETVFGPYFYVHSIYTYLLYFIAFFYLIKYSIKHLGLFSMQAFLIIICLICVFHKLYEFSVNNFVQIQSLFSAYKKDRSLRRGPCKNSLIIRGIKPSWVFRR